MKQKKKEIVSVDVSSAHVKILSGSFAEDREGSEILFDLQGVATQTGGISSRGVITDKKKLIRTIKRSLDSLASLSTHDIDQAVLLYTHPDIRFYKKTIALRNIADEKRIYITEEWMEMQKERIQERIHQTHAHRKCAYFSVVSLVVDGEEAVYDDSYDFVATHSLFLTYIYVLVPMSFVRTLLESVERFVTVLSAEPAAIVHGSLLSDIQKEQGIILCDVGAELTNVTVYQNGVLDGVYVMPFGGSTITNEIALLKKIPLDEAERVKTSLLRGDDSLLTKRDIQSIDRKIIHMFKQDLLPYIEEVSPEKNIPNGIMLFGRGSLYPDIDVTVKKATGLYTFFADVPYRHVQTHSRTSSMSWYTAYSALHNIVVRQRLMHDLLWRRYSRVPFWQHIVRFMHMVTKIFR